jgi:hypothetical protein
VSVILPLKELLFTNSTCNMFLTTGLLLWESPLATIHVQVFQTRYHDATYYMAEVNCWDRSPKGINHVQCTTEGRVGPHVGGFLLGAVTIF